jgi:DNA-binding CsgD family transcriptional regulator
MEATVAARAARSFIARLDRGGAFDVGRSTSLARRLATAAVAVGGLLAVQQWLLPGHTLHVLWITMVAAVMLTAALTGFLASIAAAFLGAVVIDLVILEPARTGLLSSGDDAVALLLFLAIAIFGASAASRPSGGTRGRFPRLPRGGSNLVEPLTERELEVLILLSRGLSNDEIARALVVSQNTVKTHLEHLYGKLGVSSRGRAVADARRRGLLASTDRITHSGDEDRQSG